MFAYALYFNQEELDQEEYVTREIYGLPWKIVAKLKLKLKGTKEGTKRIHFGLFLEAWFHLLIIHMFWDSFPIYSTFHKTTFKYLVINLVNKINPIGTERNWLDIDASLYSMLAVNLDCP